MKLQRLIGICIFIIILFKIDWHQIPVIVHQINPLYMSYAFILVAILIGLKTLRWKCILSSRGITISFRKSFEYYICSIFLGVATPGRIGELCRAYFLSQSGTASLSQGIISVIVDRLFDIYFFFVISIFGIMLFKPFENTTLVVWACCGVAVVLPILAVFRNIIIPNNIFKKLISKFSLSLQNVLVEFSQSDFPLTARMVCYASIFSIFSGAIYFFQCFIIAKAMLLPISYVEIGYIMSITTLVSLLPITIMGFGTRESALLFLMMPFDISQETILAFSFGIFIVFYMGSTFFGALFWFFSPIKTNPLRKELDTVGPKQRS